MKKFNQSKKFLSVVLSIVLIFSLALPAYATNERSVSTQWGNIIREFDNVSSSINRTSALAGILQKFLYCATPDSYAAISRRWGVDGDFGSDSTDALVAFHQYAFGHDSEVCDSNTWAAVALFMDDVASGVNTIFRSSSNCYLDYLGIMYAELLTTTNYDYRYFYYNHNNIKSSNSYNPD